MSGPTRHSHGAGKGAGWVFDLVLKLLGPELLGAQLVLSVELVHPKHHSHCPKSPKSPKPRLSVLGRHLSLASSGVLIDDGVSNARGSSRSSGFTAR